MTEITNIIKKYCLFIFRFILILCSFSLIISALNLYGIFFGFIFGCTLIEDVNSKYIFLIKASLECQTGTVGWYFTPLIGIAGILLLLALIMLLIHLFPNAAGRIPAVKRFQSYLNHNDNWKTLNIKEECFICKHDEKTLGYMCDNKTHSLCYECYKKWIKTLIQENNKISCPYCRQNCSKNVV